MRGEHQREAEVAPGEDPGLEEGRLEQVAPRAHAGREEAAVAVVAVLGEGGGERGEGQQEYVEHNKRREAEGDPDRGDGRVVVALARVEQLMQPAAAPLVRVRVRVRVRVKVRVRVRVRDRVRARVSSAGLYRRCLGGHRRRVL